MTQQITPDQVIQAARDHGDGEFTRGDLAARLGVEKSDIKPAFREARQAGKIKKTRDDDENTGHFRLTSV
jgi:transcription initiation factor IIE alpha subunit